MSQEIQLKLRNMSEEDIPRVSDLLCSCYRFIAKPDGISASQLESILDKSGSIEAVRKQAKENNWVVGLTSEEIVGVVAVKGNEVTSLFVSPANHRQGIGRALCLEGERIISTGGHRTAFLVTSGYGNKFYLSMGFTVTGHKDVTCGPLKGNQVTLMEKQI